MGCSSSDTKENRSTKFVTLKTMTTEDINFDLIMDEDLAVNRYPKSFTELRKAYETGGHCGLAARAVSPAVFEEYKNLTTPNGWTLARAINTNAMNPKSFAGCHAGDLESYSVFKKLFNYVIEQYHVGYKLDGSMKHITDMDADKITTDLEEHAKSKIISTRIRVARNLKAFPLNPAGTLESRLKIADLMSGVFSQLTGDFKGTFYRHSDMKKEEQQDLIDKHYLFRGKDKMQAASGYHAFWPHGRGIFVSKDEKFLSWVNEGDHLRLISMEKGGDVKSVFRRLSDGVKLIEQGLQKETKSNDVYMSDPILGMITCCPSNLGTCMRGSVHILLPKLIEKFGFDEIDKIARGMNCQARGSSGEHSEVVDRIDISNWRRLGFTEYSLVQDMIKCANKLSEMEDSI